MKYTTPTPIQEQATAKNGSIEMENKDMGNLFRNVMEWVLVLAAFGLVAASLYYMGLFSVFGFTGPS